MTRPILDLHSIYFIRYKDFGSISKLSLKGCRIRAPSHFEDVLALLSPIYSVWNRSGDEAFDKLNVDWVVDTIKAIKPWILGYYTNELQERLPGDKVYWEKCYEPATWSQLLALKAKHDPLGLFRSLTGSADDFFTRSPTL
ncbi:hypothetical protein BC936DRAFT_142435 [Jimgerdemannia flammicorona]|uniref:Berberine/berberine-like domain-containing protein n=1 Tax=Jimgerdemannia flammicorona TaxID=994334 RepID=A0A433DF30_9FUNG|nr:hypothetical protein BC936DRAFT_142435 [Jimgerdemannia flammicorona]